MENKALIQKTDQKSICIQHSKSLISSLTENDKFEVAEHVSRLMPGGKADLVGVKQYPPIKMLIGEKGSKNIRAVLFLLVKNFCDSVNVVRGMNEDQMIEAASFLLDECGDYRIEDYVMMFTMAKRGKLVKILDRIDIQIIGQIRNEYDAIRYSAGEGVYEAELAALNQAKLHSEKDEDPEKVKREENNFKRAVEMFRKFVNEENEKREKMEQEETAELKRKQDELLEKMIAYIVTFII